VRNLGLRVSSHIPPRHTPFAAGEVGGVIANDPESMRSWKAATSAVLIVLGCALAPVALVTVWVHNQVANTDRFVTTVSPVIREPAVRAALTDRVTDAVFTYVNVSELANEAVDALATQGVPERTTERLRGLAGPLETSVRGFVHSRVGELFASDQFTEVWDETIRVAHEQAVAVLSGSASALSIQDGEVMLDLAPFIDVAKQQLVAAGLTVADSVPDVHPTIAIADADNLVAAQSAYTALDGLATWLPWITLIVLTAGIYLARDHRRTLAASGIGLAIGMLVLAITLLILRFVLLNNVPARSVAATASTYDIVIRFLRDGLRTLLVLGLVIAVGAFLAGPSVTAQRIRAATARLIDWLRRRGPRTGPVGQWVHSYRAPLRGAAVGLAVLIFVFLDRPSATTVLIIALLLAITLAAIQFLDQPLSSESG
jgi:hypothetical protein